jgi:peptidyl-prolyl cis-trans isomerase C
MFHPRILTITIAALLLAACTRPGEDATQSAGKAASGEAASAKSAAVATVNGQKLSQELFDVFAQAVMGGSQEPPTDEQKSQMVDQLINMTLAAQAAEKEGLQKDPKVKARMELITTQVLAEAASEKYLSSHPVSESEMKAEYDAQVAAMPKEYKARHILVDTKEKADEAIAKLDAGADFAKLATAESKDSSSKNGGDLGWFSPQTMVKPFADAVEALQVGQYTKQPVQSEFGWHVILLEDVRSPEVPAFDDVKSQVEMFTQRKKLQAYIDELRKNAQIQK